MQDHNFHHNVCKGGLNNTLESLTPRGDDNRYSLRCSAVIYQRQRNISTVCQQIEIIPFFLHLSWSSCLIGSASDIVHLSCVFRLVERIRFSGINLKLR